MVAKKHASKQPADERSHLRITRDGQPIPILLVDDDPDCRLLIRDAIAQCKVSNDVHEVTNGQEALDFLHRRGKHANAPTPGLVFLDIEMPVMDGMAALKQIKATAGLRHIPIVMVAGVCDEQQMKLAAATGASSYTLKPASAEQFFQMVLSSTNYWLNVHQYPEHHIPPAECRR